MSELFMCLTGTTLLLRDTEQYSFMISHQEVSQTDILNVQSNSEYQVQSVTFSMCGIGNVLYEVKRVCDGEEVCYKGVRALVYVDIEVAYHEDTISISYRGKEITELLKETTISSRWTVDQDAVEGNPDPLCPILFIGTSEEEQVQASVSVERYGPSGYW